MDASIPERPAGSPLVHGGNLAAAKARFGISSDGWLDLSTGINPNPYPLPSVPRDAWARLPDGGLDLAARRAAAGRYGAPDADHVLAAPGTQSLIQWLPRLRAPGRLAVIGPTYEEHHAAWSAAGHAVETIDAREVMAAAAAVDAIIVVNPNNPDGHRFDPDHLLEIEDRLARRGGLLIVDEAFADVEPGLSLCGKVGERRLIVLRSFGKFFGLAGLRLGFALAAPALLDRLRGLIGPWAVGGPALSIAAEALADSAWIEATGRHLAADARRLDTLLTDAGLAVIGGTDLYRLTTTPKAEALYEFLGRRGILIRPFPQFPDRLRWGLPGDDAAFERLTEGLAAWNEGTA
jgi:cobalamin biosynthesis protein CobC